MALYAAQHYGCKVTTTTLSKEQYAYTAKRIEALGLQDQVTLLLKDYRDLTGQYDKLVSIEMIEAVGHRFLPTYFKQCAQLLKSNGLMLLQAITIREQRYEQAKNSVDFIQRYIFPGGALPCVQKMLQIVSRDTDMNLLHMEDFGLHYARTLRLWHENFRRAHGRLSELGYDDYFLRLWEFYLCYCEGGFWSAPSAPRNCCWPSRRPSGAAARALRCLSEWPTPRCFSRLAGLRHRRQQSVVAAGAGGAGDSSAAGSAVGRRKVA
jgi:cyclopropane-fatty-acyl-phospholipid synthase